MVLIKGSDTDYIAPSGIVYADYDNDMYFPKYPFENKHNNYMYTNVRFSDGKMRQRRVHVLLAKAFIFNPDPKNLIEPTWLIKKFCVLNDIDKEMKKRNTYQGKKLEKNAL